MTDSASDSRESGADNFPFSDPPVIPVGGNVNDTVIAEHDPLIESQDSRAGDFAITGNVAERLSPNNPAFDPHGVQLGQFTIDSLIGSGGMGAVFKADDSSLQRTIALKILSLQHSRDEGLVARFMNEARSCARLNHENIARIFFIGEDKGIHFIAFEYIEGKNLRDVLAERSWLTSAEALNYTLQIAFALRQTSKEGVVHRDIKPSNIIINEAGRAKLVDLGLARKSGEDSVGDLTEFGATLGTFDFIAPEQARDARAVDVRSDIYSLGCTLYNMLTGRLPYPDGTALQKLLSRSSEPPPDPRTINSAVDEELASIVQKMMEIKPDDRYDDTDELIADLLSVGAHQGLRGVNPESLIWIQPKERRKGIAEKLAPWLLAGSALLLMAALSDIFPDSSPAVITNSADRTFDPAKNSPPQPMGAEGDKASSPRTTPGESTDSIVLPGGSEELIGEPKMGGSAPTAFPGSFPETISDAMDVISPLIEDGTRLITNAGNDSNNVQPEVTDSNPDIGMTPSTAPEAKDIRRISLHSDSTREFESVEAAIAEADDGDIIKLRFNGSDADERSFVETRPAQVTHKNITIRAEAGFRPVIRFSLDSDFIESENAIVKVVGGSIDLVDVDLELVVPDSVLSASWALFSLQESDRIGLDNVMIRCINPSMRTASLFQVRSGSRLERIRDDGTMPQDTTFRVDIDDSRIHGNCSLFAIENAVPGDVEVRNSAVAIGDSLISYSVSDGPVDDKKGRIDLQLEHVTCLFGKHLVDVKGASGAASEGRLQPLVVTANNNIFSASSANALIAMSGNNNMEQFRSMVVWNGNRNWYDRIGSFWQIEALLDDAVDDFDFERWKGYWRDEINSFENGAMLNELIWQFNLTDKQPADLQLIDLTLDPSSRAIGGATDRKDIGVDRTGVDWYRLQDSTDSVN